MVMSPAGLGPNSDGAGKAQQQLYQLITDTSSRQEGRSIKRKPQMSENIFPWM
jgi:hypothetical protein